MYRPAYGAAKPQTVHHRHDDIENEQVHPLAFRHRQGFQTTDHLGDTVAAVTEVDAEYRKNVLVIIYDKGVSGDVGVGGGNSRSQG